MHICKCQCYRGRASKAKRTIGCADQPCYLRWEENLVLGHCTWQSLSSTQQTSLSSYLALTIDICLESSCGVKNLGQQDAENTESPMVKYFGKWKKKKNPKKKKVWKSFQGKKSLLQSERREVTTELPVLCLYLRAEQPFSLKVRE